MAIGLAGHEPSTNVGGPVERAISIKATSVALVTRGQRNVLRRSTEKVQRLSRSLVRAIRSRSESWNGPK
jgi:hypothetical protein